jgi:hypothetical protein
MTGLRQRDLTRLPRRARYVAVMLVVVGKMLVGVQVRIP